MKKSILTFIMAIAAVVAVQAQQISVVSPQGATTLFTDLNIAIREAAPGSIVYLSGGAFQISDTTKITKKLTIIGTGYRTDNGNVDGHTLVTGKINFMKGADNSTLMGIYLTGDLNIADASGSVNTLLVRYCNLYRVSVGNAECHEVLINQNYIRLGPSIGGGSPIRFENNILHSIFNINGGIISNNVVLHATTFNFSRPSAIGSFSSSRVANNLFFAEVSPDVGLQHGNNTFFNNYFLPSSAALAAQIDGLIIENIEEFIVGPNNGVSTTSNFHLKNGSPGKNAGTDGTDIGIYGGTGFNDLALPPIPRIVAKRIAEQTDEQGNLKVQVKVKAE